MKVLRGFQGHRVCLAFELPEAPAVLGLRTDEQARESLRLLRKAGWLITNPSGDAEGHPFTIPISLSGQRRRRRHVVVSGHRERLQAERTARSLCHDEKLRNRA